MTDDDAAREQPAAPPVPAAGAAPSAGTAAAPARRGRSVLDRTVIVLVVLVVVAIGVLLGITVLPRWWAGRVAGVADRSLTAGIFAGLTCGVVFTAVPLLLLRAGIARQRSWRARGIWFLAGLLFALPNLITLGIALGNGSSARAASTSMDVDAPGFRTASAVGAVLGAILVAGWWALWASRRRRVREVHRLRDQLALRDHPAGQQAGQPAEPADPPRPERPGAGHAE